MSDSPSTMFACRPPEPPTLTFEPVPRVYDETGIEAFQAARGAFLFNIMGRPDLAGGFDISITFQPSYFPKGPFRTLDEAIVACNRAAYGLEN